jgi:tetratricopeptide (TPR) repeat protein
MPGRGIRVFGSAYKSLKRANTKSNTTIPTEPGTRNPKPETRHLIPDLMPRFILHAFLILALLASTAVAQSVDVDQKRLDEVRSHYATAQSFEKANDWVSAEREWEFVIKLAPKDARAWVNFGVALNRQNKTRDALSAWTKAIELDPTLAGAHFNIGLARVRANEFAEAIIPLRRALMLEQDNEGARRALVLALIGLERFQEASREIAQLLVRVPRDAKLLELAAQTFMQQDRYSEAAIVLKRRLDSGDETSQLWAQYGDALDGVSRTPEALEAYKKAVELAPDSTVTRYGLGFLYWKQNRYDEAERELTDVLRRDPQDARAAFTLGDLYLTRGDAKRALPFLELAARDYPNEFDTRFALGRALAQTGSLERGIAELRTAVQLQDAIADGHFHLGRALIQAGQSEEGKREMERARDLKNAKRVSERLPEMKP